MSIRIQVPLIIEMDDRQLASYAQGVPPRDGRLAARDVVADVQAYVLEVVQNCAAFGDEDECGAGATVTIKRRQS